MKPIIKLTLSMLLGLCAFGLQSCGGHPEIDIEKIYDYASRMDSLEDEYDITADDTDGIVGQFQAVVDEVEECGKDKVWEEFEKKYSGKAGIILGFASDMHGIAMKKKHNLGDNGGMIWSDVEKLPFTSSQFTEIIAQAERLETLK